jgi:hypothetical protein
MINEGTILNYDIDLEWKALMSDVFNPYLKVPDIIIISASHHYDMGKYMTVPHSTKIRVDQNIYRLALQRVCSILSNITNNNDISPKIVVLLEMFLLDITRKVIRIRMVNAVI